MRVRTFELRLLAAVLTALWGIAAAIVVIGYRPGGPVDGLVGLAALLPIAVSLLGLLWPPAARGDRAFAAVAWVGLLAVLLLIPSIAGVLAQVVAQGPQTLLPSWEAAYPWLLALLATALFGGLGVARHILGSTALRSRRILLGLVIAVVATVLSGSLFAAAAISNESALRDTPARASRFGPTYAATEPPACTAPISIGPTANLELDISGDVDGRPIGTVEVNGERSGSDVSWTADIATDVQVGQSGLVRLGGTTWTRTPGGGWQTSAPAPDVMPPPIVADPALDATVLPAALPAGDRITAEDRGLEFVEGARARHCRIALDGTTFQEAFPEARWMSSEQDLHRWRGELDYWIFLDGQVGQVQAAMNGEAESLGRDGLMANLLAKLMATDRGAPVTVEAPT
jgi:hypothetical protein